MKSYAMGLLITASITLSGCAMSAAGLGRTKVEDVYTSNRSPSDVASCISTHLMMSNPVLTDGPDHYIVLRKNAYGVPNVRWDIYKTETGSRIEFRRSLAISSGEKKAMDCFGPNAPAV